MTEREFCYWLQGFFELKEPDFICGKQTEMIRKHLALVFTNVTAKAALAPKYAAPDPNRSDGVKPLGQDIDWWRRQAQWGERTPPLTYC